MFLNALVVDDELPAREELTFMLESSGKVRVVGECEDGDEVIPFLLKTPVDVVFLDIKMRVQNGLSTAWQIIQLERPPKIVFTTGFSQHAQEAFELNAVDYIMKPYLQDRINRSVMKAIDNIKAGQANSPILSMINKGDSFEPNRLVVWKNDRLVVIAYSDVIYAKADANRKTAVITAKGAFQANFSLKELEEKLKPPTFLRTHKSYIVNLDKVQEIVPWFNNTYLLKLVDSPDHDVPVARHYIKQFQSILGIS